MMDNQNEQQAQSNAKAEKQYQQTLTKLHAVLGTDNLIPNERVNHDDLKDIVADLFKEEREANKKTLKLALKKLLKDYSEMQTLIEAQAKALEQLKAKKHKEYVAACNAVYKSIEDIDGLTKAYTNSLKESFSTSSDEDKIA